MGKSLSIEIFVFFICQNVSMLTYTSGGNEGPCIYILTHKNVFFHWKCQASYKEKMVITIWERRSTSNH